MPMFTNHTPLLIARHQMSLEQFKHWLSSIDKDGDGCISKKELVEALRGHGLWFKRFRARRALARIDVNSNGIIDGAREFDELMEYAQKHWGFVFST